MNKEKQEQYKAYVEKKTPKSNLWVNMVRAFVTGGAICVVGQFILDFCKKQGLSEDNSGAWTSLILVLISVLLTAFNVYGKLAQWAGAGALVPITGFANSVAAPAIEYQKDESDIIGHSQKDLIDKGRVWRFSLT